MLKSLDALPVEMQADIVRLVNNEKFIKLLDFCYSDDLGLTGRIFVVMQLGTRVDKEEYRCKGSSSSNNYFLYTSNLYDNADVAIVVTAENDPLSSFNDYKNGADYRDLGKDNVLGELSVVMFQFVDGVLYAVVKNKRTSLEDFVRTVPNAEMYLERASELLM